MNWFSRNKTPASRSGHALVLQGLDVYYGSAHAVQEVSLELSSGLLAVVGRNGMGKSTLCNAITGLVPANGRVTGSVRLNGKEIRGLMPNRITEAGIGYVPQGRRVWPSLTVDETLKLAAGTRQGSWTIDRIYETFPRLGERKNNGGGQLSGGEQQMLAISRALLFNPSVLVMDEPTEGLAPVIVQQVADMLQSLAHEGDIAVLLIEQNLGVAMQVADDIAIMVNGRIARRLPASELAADVQLQQQLLGIKSSLDEEIDITPTDIELSPRDEIQVFTIKRSGDSNEDGPSLNSNAGGERLQRGYNRWSAADAHSTEPKDQLISGRTKTAAEAMPSSSIAAIQLAQNGKDTRVVEFPVAATMGRAAYVAGTFDTKAKELFFIRSCIEKLGVRTVTVDLSTSGKPSPAMVHPREIARHHPRGERAVFTGDRGSATIEMSVAFEHYIRQRRDLGGIISAGGSGGTALATPAMRALPIGVPKMMVSTVASGDVKPYVGPSDITMMYSVTDVSGINRISEKVLSNAAHALAGMISYSNVNATSDSRPAIGFSMFGVTTPCVQAVAKQLEENYDCLIFHATGTGGQSMEKLVESGLLAGVLDITTTEIADELVGGVLTAGPSRMDAMIKSRIPYVGSCGALDMVNFWAMDTVPTKFNGRKFIKHNSNVTLMRTTLAENIAIGKFIVDKLNRMEGPVRFLIPEGGVSAVDAVGQSFWDPAADKALFDTIASGFKASNNRKLMRLPYNINDSQFSDALVAAFNEIASPSLLQNQSANSSINHSTSLLGKPYGSYRT
jgi:uncharacterized protein (UPF0261 family)/ABC-type branched-subunit amino acid transport system ATPase component